MKILPPRGSWPASWCPLVHDYKKEPFGDWWSRFGNQFPALDPRVLEQWIYKHWDQSEYWGLSLRGLRSEPRELTTETILSQVGHPDLRWGKGDHPDDFEYLSAITNKGLRVEPMRSIIDTGTWNFPMLLFESLDGFRYQGVRFPDQRYWLIEGHQRRRFLAAAAGKVPLKPTHQVLVLVRD